MLMGHSDVLHIVFAAVVWFATYALVAILGIFCVCNFVRTSIF